jgi:DNA-binding LacI/PurR family transcriptional regulator
MGRITLDAALDQLEAENIIYRRQGSGIFVSSQIHTKSIRILMDMALVEAAGYSPFWGYLWGLISKEAQNRCQSRNVEIRFELVSEKLYKNGPLPEETLLAMDSGMIHGILNIGLSNRIVGCIVERKIPMVTFAGGGDWRVAVEVEAMLPELVRALAGLDCAKIALWPQPPILEDPSWRPYNSLFAKEVAHCGLEPYGESFRMPEPDDNTQPTRQDYGYQLAMQFHSRRNRPDGIVILDDMMTSGALVAFNELGIRVGVDVQIATLANKDSTVLYGYEKNLIRAEVDPAAIVLSLFDVLDTLLEGKEPARKMTMVRPVLKKMV